MVLARGARKEAWLFYGFAAALMGMTIVVSLSRGGIVSLLAGIAFVIAMSIRHEKKHGRGADDELNNERQLAAHRSLLIFKRIGIAASLIFVITLGVVWIGAEGVINRAADSIYDLKGGDARGDLFSRPEIWKDSWKMIREHPVTGVGLGAYQTVFPIYARSNGMLVVNYAHNDYMQAVTDGGIVGGLLALAFVVLILRSVFRAVKSGDPLLRALAIAFGGGIFSILTHSLFDFNLQIPSNALLFLFISAAVTNIAATVDERKPESAVNRAASVNAGGYATGV
jgi:O-antigen ligase